MSNPIMCRFCEAEIPAGSDTCSVCGSPLPPPKPSRPQPAIRHIETAPTINACDDEAPPEPSPQRIVIVIRYDR
jgi:hypothetical protein